MIIDDGASQDQVAALGWVLGGELGGPPAAVAPFLGEFLGMEQIPITITNDGGATMFKRGRPSTTRASGWVTPTATP